jgi:hypothetical protein
MEKKKMGRPRSVRQDASIKFDKILLGRARHVAQARGIGIAEYLSELSRPLIDRDYRSLLKELEPK